MPTRVELGRRIREERQRQSLTLKAVEDLSGVSATHISQIERGITWPTVNALDKIARALKKNTSFFLEEFALPEVCKVSGNTNTIVFSDSPRVMMRPLSLGIPGGRLHFYMLTAHSGSKDGFTTHYHDGDEVGFVLSGRIEVKVGDEVIQLKQGESIHFSGMKPHGIRNSGTTPSESVWAALSMGF